MALKHIDQDTIYPNGKRGLPGRATTTVINENTAETEQRLVALEGESGGVSAAIQALEQEQAALQADLAGEAQARQADLTGEAQARQAADAALGFRIPGKNRLINGNFDISQRKSGQAYTNATTEVYTADRWVVGFVGSTGNWGIGGTPVGAVPESQRFLGYNITALANSATSNAYIGQKIESVRSLAGKTATLSFWARSSVAGKKIGCRVLQLFGSGGSPSGIVQIVSPDVKTLTTFFQRYSVTFEIPSVVGKTLGTAGNDSLFVVLDYASPDKYGGQLVGQLGLFEVAQVQFEQGDQATDYDYRPISVELGLCQRYYEKSYDPTTEPGTASTVGYASSLVAANGYFLSSAPVFKVAKRSSPAVITYRYDNGSTSQMTEYGTTGSLLAGRPTSVTNISTNGFEVRSDSSPGAGNAVRYHWTADAEI